jgi:hypothetical protein
MKTILLVVALMLALTLFAAVAAGTHRAQMRSETSTTNGMTNGMMNSGMMLPFTAEYEEVPGGIRLTLRPTDPAHLEEFRVQVRQHAERMKNGECPMMSGMMNRMTQDMVPKAETAPPDHSAHHE